jgi:hypothetical protein
VRRPIIVVVMVTIGCLLLGLGPAEAGTLKVRPPRRGPGGTVTFSGTTGCRPKVYLSSQARGHIKAINPTSANVRRRPGRRTGTFGKNVTIRKQAKVRKDTPFTIVSRCKNGKRSGHVILTLARTGLPVLPQLLVGFGLIGSGVAMLRGDRRAGTSRPRRRRRRSRKPLWAIGMGADG